uniref:Uncharacterized protein n=1 Tax=Molossus molossus TaxID=27622 RepID=A0A7J8J741_MOLMO|nr:hypothetical protein HJG59_009564 [Molossus molossus]
MPDQTEDHEHFYLFQACECHKCDLLSVLPAESAFEMDHGPHLNRHPTRDLRRSGSTPPRHRSFVKKMAIQGSVLTGKDNVMPQCKAHPCATPREEISQGSMRMNQAPNSLSLSWTPAPLKKQLTISPSGTSHRPPALRGSLPQLLARPRFLPPQSGGGSWRRPRLC